MNIKSKQCMIKPQQYYAKIIASGIVFLLCLSILLNIRLSVVFASCSYLWSSSHRFEKSCTFVCCHCVISGFTLYYNLISGSELRLAIAHHERFAILKQSVSIFAVSLYMYGLF